MIRHRQSYYVMIGVFAALTLLLAGCARMGGDEPVAEPIAEPQADVPQADVAALDTASDEARAAVEREEAAVEPAMLPAATTGPALSAGMADVYDGAEMAVEESVEGRGGLLAAAPGESGAARGAGSDAEPFVVPPDQQFQPLQAGEIDDNDDFATYLEYRSNFRQYGLLVHDRDVSERHVIRVTNRRGLPVLGAEVLIYDGRSLVTTLRTTATGSVYFFPRVYTQNARTPFDVVVQKGQDRTAFRLTRERTDVTWPVTLDAPGAQPPVNLDVLFLIDATGSMSDEIDELKENILSISAQIEALPSRPDVRFGLVSYRDRGDDYVTRVSDFTGDVTAFQRDLAMVMASGGGDAPESLNEALYRAVQGVSWRVEDTVSLIILVADAPPHLDYLQDYDYAVEMQNAASLGIKIFPIGSRLDGPGADEKVAEYVFRQLAQYTGGNFIFLTYADTPQSSGEPGTGYTVEEGSYTVQDLDALVVRLIQEELAALSGGQS